jgi:hypothetical protein
MMGDDLLAALELPPGCRVDRRVPKKLLLENGAPTASDKKLITTGIEDIHWIAALKPNTSGVPAYQNHERTYLEIAVLRLHLRPEARKPRLIELLHRAVPYPALLLTDHGPHRSLSAVPIRWAKNEAEKTVLDGEVIAVSSEDAYDPACWRDFVASLGIAWQPRGSLLALYQGWMDCLIGLKASMVTGRFRKADDLADIEARRKALVECERLTGEIADIRNAAAKEKQMPRRVEMNVQMKRLESALEQARMLMDGKRA